MGDGASTMESRVDPRAALPVLKAATRIREEVCGLLSQKAQVEHRVSRPLAELILDPRAEA
jgi:hypothetical protein